MKIDLCFFVRFFNVGVNNMIIYLAKLWVLITVRVGFFIVLNIRLLVAELPLLLDNLIVGNTWCLVGCYFLSVTYETLILLSDSLK